MAQFDNKEFHGRLQKIEQLVQTIQSTTDPNVRASAVELMQSVMEYHGAGLERMMDIVAEAGEAGYAVFDRFAQDELVGSLLLLYGLHPLTLEERVTRALDHVRPYLDSHGGNVELLSVEGDVVRLRLQGNCKSCPSSAMTLKHAIEEAIYEAAPDVTAIEAEEMAAPPAPSGFVQLERKASYG
ncbi:hypothetical protein BH18ACI2_BH18ACI2_13690 [soil metagenome]